MVLSSSRIFCLNEESSSSWSMRLIVLFKRSALRPVLLLPAAPRNVWSSETRKLFTIDCLEGGRSDYGGGVDYRGRLQGVRTIMVGRTGVMVAIIKISLIIENMDMLLWNSLKIGISNIYIK